MDNYRLDVSLFQYYMLEYINIIIFNILLTVFMHNKEQQTKTVLSNSKNCENYSSSAHTKNRLDIHIIKATVR